MTDAEIAGYMGWRGPGAYTQHTLRKIREIVGEAQRREREACAKVCDDLERQKWESVRDILSNGGKLQFVGPVHCAKAIRARGDK